jgi:hypothetical protein
MQWGHLCWSYPQQLHVSTGKQSCKARNLDEIAELAKQGIKPMFSRKQPGLVSFAYLDTEKIGEVNIGLLQWD